MKVYSIFQKNIYLKIVTFYNMNFQHKYLRFYIITCLKKIIISALNIIAISCFTLFEAYSQPNPINIESVSLYKHGTNSTDIVGPVAGEAIDSVTIESTTKYFDMPDPVVNPSYNFGTDPYSNVFSTFVWIVTPSISSAGAVVVPAHNTAMHYKQITWTSTGIGNIQVTERSNAGCNGSTITVPVEVIAAPTVQYSSTSSSDCRTEADSSVNYSLTGIPISWTSSVSGKRQLMVNITISCSNSEFGTPQTYNNIAITETGAGTGTFDLPIVLNYYGVYTITLTAINDRISTKSGVEGTVGASSAYTFLLSKTPVTNPLFHVPNE